VKKPGRPKQSKFKDVLDSVRGDWSGLQGGGFTEMPQAAERPLEVNVAPVAPIFGGKLQSSETDGVKDVTKNMPDVMELISREFRKNQEVVLQLLSVHEQRIVKGFKATLEEQMAFANRSAASFGVEGNDFLQHAKRVLDELNVERNRHESAGSALNEVEPKPTRNGHELVDSSQKVLESESTPVGAVDTSAIAKDAHGKGLPKSAAEAAKCEDIPQNTVDEQRKTAPKDAGTEPTKIASNCSTAPPHELEEVNINFSPGEIGIQVDTNGVVSEVIPKSQAEEKGVQTGWRILKLDGADYCKEQMDKLIGGTQDFSASFGKEFLQDVALEMDDFEERYNRTSISVKDVLRERELQSRKPELWTQSSRFGMAVGAIIMLNALCIGIEADLGGTYPFFFEVLEIAFAVVFIVELGLRFTVEGFKEYFGDKGNWLDFVLVILTAVDVFVISRIGVDADMRLVSLLRIIRIARLARLLRLVRIFKELTLIIQGFVSGARSLAWASGFLLMVVYIFAIFARQQIGASYRCPDGMELRSEWDTCPGGDEREFGYNFNEEIGDQYELFGSITRTTLTLLVCLSEGCGMDVVHPTVRQTPYLSIFWLLFVGLTTFGVLNLIIGLFCEHSTRIANDAERDMQKAQEEMRREKLQQLKDTFMSIDADGSGDITKEEYLEAITSNDEVIKYMVEVGLDNETDLFDKIDGDGNGIVAFNEFFEGLTLIMKGSEPALAKDMVPTFMRVSSLNRAHYRFEQDILDLKDEQHEAKEALAELRSAPTNPCLNNAINKNDGVPPAPDSSLTIQY
jgi:hypothetical protein